MGFAFANDKYEEMHDLFNEKGKLTKRKAYSFGLSKDGATLLELSYHLNNQGYTLAEMDMKYQQQRQAEREITVCSMQRRENYLYVGMDLHKDPYRCSGELLE